MGPNIRRSKDLPVRAASVLAILVALISVRGLYSLVHMPPDHAPSALEMALAAVAFIGMSAGSVLAILGRQLLGHRARAPASAAPTALASSHPPADAKPDDRARPLHGTPRWRPRFADAAPHPVDPKPTAAREPPRLGDAAPHPGPCKEKF